MIRGRTLSCAEVRLAIRGVELRMDARPVEPFGTGEKRPPQKATATKAGVAQEGGASAPVQTRLVSVWGFDFGFGHFFGDLGGVGELGAIPATAQGFDQLDGGRHFLGV